MRQVSPESTPHLKRSMAGVTRYPGPQIGPSRVLRFLSPTTRPGSSQSFPCPGLDHEPFQGFIRLRSDKPAIPDYKRRDGGDAEILRPLPVGIDGDPVCPAVQSVTGVMFGQAQLANEAEQRVRFGQIESVNEVAPAQPLIQPFPPGCNPESRV